MITDPDVQRYAEEHTTAPPPWLQELEHATREELSSPQMLTGRLEGRLLETLVFATRARRVLELGTYSGYSALAMAAALPEDGELITCEIDSRRADFARQHVARTRYADRIEIRVGPALETLRVLDGRFDLIFIDADKGAYPSYFEESLRVLADHGIIVLDNTLRGGAVLDHGTADDNTRVIAALNERLANDERVVSVVLPVRDGVTLVRRADGAHLAV